MIYVFCPGCGCGLYCLYADQVYKCRQDCTIIEMKDDKFVVYKFIINYQSKNYDIYSSSKGTHIFYKNELIFRSNQMTYFPLINDCFQVLPFLTRIINLKSFL